MSYLLQTIISCTLKVPRNLVMLLKNPQTINPKPSKIPQTDISLPGNRAGALLSVLVQYF